SGSLYVPVTCWVFNRLHRNSRYCFRIYRETLSRFRAPLHQQQAHRKPGIGIQVRTIDRVPDTVQSDADEIAAGLAASCMG
ncbi:hypothetical protein P4123_21970, partial [Pseudomonas aeruginosa]|nr:hypothetical protein [Pseudomonas aeruginosa]